MVYFTNTTARGYWTNGSSFNPVFSPATSFVGITNNVVFTDNVNQAVSFSNSTPIMVGSITLMPSNLASCLVTAFINAASDLWITNGLTIGAIGSGLNSTSTLALKSGEIDVTNSLGSGIVTVGQSPINRGSLTISVGTTLICDQFYATNNYFGSGQYGSYSNSTIAAIAGTLQINNGSHISMWGTSGYSSANSPFTISAGGKLIYAGGTNVIDNPAGNPVGVGVQLLQLNGNFLAYSPSCIVTMDVNYPASVGAPFVLGPSFILSNGASMFIRGAGGVPSASSTTQMFIGLPNMTYLNQTGGTWTVGTQAGGTGGGSFDYLYATNSSFKLNILTIGNANGSNNMVVMYGGYLTNNGAFNRTRCLIHMAHLQGHSEARF